MTATLTYNSVQVSGGLHAPVVSAPVVITGGVINPLLGNYFQAAVSGDITFSLTTLPGAVTNSAFTLEIQYTGGVITWFSGIQWSNGISPIPSVGTITYNFITQDGGTTWRAIGSEIYIPPTAPSFTTLNVVGTTYATDNTTIALPAGTAAGDLCIYYDHPESGTSTTFFSVTPTSGSGGAWTSLGGSYVSSTGNTNGAYMWFRVLTAGDISTGTVSGRSTPTTTSYRLKSLVVLRPNTGSITTATAGTSTTDTGLDNAVAIATSGVATNSIAVAVYLVVGGSSDTSVAVTDNTAYTAYSDASTTQCVSGLSIITAIRRHGIWKVIPKGRTKYNVSLAHDSAGNAVQTARNWIVVT